MVSTSSKNIIMGVCSENAPRRPPLFSIDLLNMFHRTKLLQNCNQDSLDHSIYIYGMKFPNRLFVGGLPKTAEAKELADFFELFGTVVEAKIIMNKQGASRGYGFVTFMGSSDVQNVIKQGQLYFHGSKLNLGPAVRKQAPDVPGETVMVVQHPTTTANTSPISGQSRTPERVVPLPPHPLPQMYFSQQPIFYPPAAPHHGAYYY